jgi:hypothetical protein
MSKVTYPLVGVSSRDLVIVACRFQINGTSNPDSLVPIGGAVTDVVRNGAGLFDIYLDQKYSMLIACVASVEQAASLGAGSAIAVAPGVTNGASVYNSSTGVLSIRTADPDASGAVALADPADNSWVHVIAVFARSSNSAAAGAI